MLNGASSLSDISKSAFSPKARRLLMLYDAPSGTISAILEGVKKVFGMGCSLCALTHGLTGKRAEWEEFEQNCGIKVEYYHNDEIAEIKKKLGRDFLPPAVVVELQDGSMEILLSHLTIRNLEHPSTERLTKLILFWAQAKGISL